MATPSLLPLIGVDFTSAPTRRKPITVARGQCIGHVLRLEAVDAFETFAAFEALLATPGPWLGAFDFPFGLPREFIESLGLGQDIGAVITELHRRCARRMDFRRLVDAWSNARPRGQRLVHRRTDRAMPGIHSTSPLQTRYVPVGFMFFEGLQRLVAAGVDLPGMRAGDVRRTALEGYPGKLAFELVGRRSYKNDASADRLIARKDIVTALEQGPKHLGLRLKLTPAMHERLVDDASGDSLDAVLCLLQAGWASQRPGYGLPPDIDPLEGWIVSA
jgi:Protein of unknown function (DUF429)